MDPKATPNTTSRHPAAPLLSQASAATTIDPSASTSTNDSNDEVLSLLRSVASGMSVLRNDMNSLNHKLETQKRQEDERYEQVIGMVTELKQHQTDADVPEEAVFRTNSKSTSSLSGSEAFSSAPKKLFDVFTDPDDDLPRVNCTMEDIKAFIVEDAKVWPTVLLSKVKSAHDDYIPELSKFWYAFSCSFSIC